MNITPGYGKKYAWEKLVAAGDTITIYGAPSTQSLIVAGKRYFKRRGEQVKLRVRNIQEGVHTVERMT